MESTYAPPGPGIHQAWLEIEESGLSDPFIVPLSGRAAPNAWIEETVQAGTQLDLLIVAGDFDPAAIDVWTGDPILPGGYETLVQAIRGLVDRGIDVRVAALHPFEQTFLNLAIGESMPPGTDPGTWKCPQVPPDHWPSYPARPEPWWNDGTCGYFAAGLSTGTVRDDWRVITATTRPSLEVALGTNLGGLPVWTPGLGPQDPYFGYAVESVLYYALSSPLRQTWNRGLLRRGAPLLILEVGTFQRARTSYINRLLLALLRGIEGGRRTDLMHDIVWVVERRDRPDHESSQLTFEAPCDSVEALREACDGCTPLDVYDARTQPTGGVLVNPACEPDWMARVVADGLPINGHRKSYPLGQPARSETLEVRIDGVPVPSEGPSGPIWVYSATYNRVDFVGTAKPGFGQEVTFRYQARCE